MRFSRRQVLAGAVASLGLTAAAQLGSTSSASAAPAGPSTPPPAPGIPVTRGRSRVANGTSRVVQTEFPLSHLGFSWPHGDPPRVRLLTAGGWQGWQAVRGCPGGRDGAVGAAQGALLLASGATGYEVVCGGGAALLNEIDVVSGPIRLSQASVPTAGTLAGRPLPAGFCSRASWGADESLRIANGAERYPPEYYPVQALTVHHTVSRMDDPDPAATVRAIYYDHTVTRDWGDIGYHLLIDQAGVIYEGRWSGDDPLPVFGGAPSGDGRPQANNAAHVLNYNAGNIGLALLGDCSGVEPTAKAVDSLVSVLAILSSLCRLDPRGKTTYVNPVTRGSHTVNTISGHRDWGSTECPGDKLYPLLPQIRERAAGAAGRV